LLYQDGDLTNESDGDANGATAMLIFDSIQSVITYDTQDPATLDSTDNMAPEEPFTFTDDDNNEYKLTLGTLTSDDESVLIVPSGAGFNFTKSITTIVLIATRLGLGSNISTVVAPA
jgi:hypothetical protein